MKLHIGDHINWRSAEGHLDGKITDIFLSENALYQTVPWIVVGGRITLCATDENLTMLCVEKITDVMGD